MPAEQFLAVRAETPAICSIERVPDAFDKALANADLYAEDERARLRHRHVPVRTAPASSTG